VQLQPSATPTFLCTHLWVFFALHMPNFASRQPPGLMQPQKKYFQHKPYHHDHQLFELPPTHSHSTKKHIKYIKNFIFLFSSSLPSPNFQKKKHLTHFPLFFIIYSLFFFNS
jgi:hypothetical protein